MLYDDTITFSVILGVRYRLWSHPVELERIRREICDSMSRVGSSLSSLGPFHLPLYAFFSLRDVLQSELWAGYRPLLSKSEAGMY